MMTCSRNLFKHLKHCYQIKTNREMLQHDFHFFVNLVTFSFFKVIKYALFIFIFHICAKFQTKTNMNVFNHSHILKELNEFLCMMGAITIFGKSSFIFNFGGYELVTRSLRDWVHI
jgi:hypothetical protein